MADNIGVFHSEQAWTPAVQADATQSNGVMGKTTSNKDSAVYGVHGGDGIGVFGRGGASAGEGVFGQTDNPSSGVYGKNTSNGPGVTGESAGGFAMVANGDTYQTLRSGGWVKALVHLSSGAIKRFFTSQPGGPQPVCYRLDRGVYSIDFQFPVNDRYVTVTPVAGTYNQQNPFAPSWWPPSSGSVFESKFFIANIVFDGLTAPPSYNTPVPGQRQASPTMITVLTYQPVFQNAGGGVLQVQGFQLQDCDVCVAIL
jgi:hypothetical protein